MSTDPPTATPAAEVGIDAALVRGLLEDQHADLADLRLRTVDAGWDNAMFRLGDDLAVRLPRRELAAPLCEHEQRWLPRLAPQLPLEVPAPLRVGEPGRGYPWRWSVVPWLSGEPADTHPPRGDAAATLAGFLGALHVPAPDDAPHNPFRGVPLAEREAIVTERLDRLAARGLLGDALVAIWRDALAAPPAAGACWIHGDLHARNVLVRDGEIHAVIDWGDVCAGDPATDLAALWMLLESPEARRRAMRDYGGTTDLWRRARGWAVSFGSVLLETGLADNPRHAEMGARTLARVVAGE